MVNRFFKHYNNIFHNKIKHQNNSDFYTQPTLTYKFKTRFYIVEVLKLMM